MIINGRTLSAFLHVKDGAEYDDGYADGKQAEYDRFWDAFQENGNKINYAYTFGGFTDETFAPKYNIVFGNGERARYAFQRCAVTDLKGILERGGVSIDLTRTTESHSHFYNMPENTRLPKMDYSHLAVRHYNTFAVSPKLVEIEEFVVNVEATFAQVFNGCTSLTTIKIGGAIGQSGLSFGDSPNLSDNSLYSIADALVDRTAVWIKGSEYVPQSDYFIVNDYLYGSTNYVGPCFTTTGEQVYVGVEYEDESQTFYTSTVFVCVVDGKYYTCTPTDNTDTYTITLNSTLQNTEGGLYFSDKAVQKGWTVVWK